MAESKGCRMIALAVFGAAVAALGQNAALATAGSTQADSFSLSDATATPVYAQAASVEVEPTGSGRTGGYGFFKGDREFTLAGSGSASSDFEANTFGFATSLGFFIEDNLELAARLNAAFASPSESSYQAGVGVAIDYHFNFGRLNPYVGANVGYNFGDGTEDAISAGPEGGVKYFLNDTTFLVGNITYQWAFADNEDDDEGRFSYSIGLGLKF